MPEGLNGKKYDFKDRGIGEGDNEQIYRHRGMPLESMKMEIKFLVQHAM